MKPTPQKVTRRQFLKRAGAVLATPFIVPASVLGRAGAVAPSARINMGFIGLGTQGGGHLVGGAWTYLTGGFLGREEVQIRAVCDIARGKREDYQARVNNHYAEKFGRGHYTDCAAYNDFRELLARPDLDAVLIATPVHWHALMSVLAAQAGKDVYCEKPVSLTIQEGRSIVEAVQRNGRIFQAGTQQRSCYGGVFRKACTYVRNGGIGQLKAVYAMLGGGGFTPTPEHVGRAQKIPEGVDWELFLGPAPQIPFHGSLNAHMFGWGSINWGQHHYDIVQWGLGADRTGPVKIGWEDGKLAYTYAHGVTVYGCRYPGEPIGDTGGAIFVGTEGRIAVDREHLAAYPETIFKQPLPADGVQLYHATDHATNFLECVRTRRPTICEAETAHRAMSVILVGGIAETLRRPLRWDPARETFPGDREANRQLGVALRAPWTL
jgi:predicted dehydrogenase